MAHGSKMISRVLEEADQAIGMARHFAPRVAAGRLQVEGNVAPGLGVVLESIAARLAALRERLSADHLRRSQLRAFTLLQHEKVRAKADYLRYLLVDVRFHLDRTCGKGKGHADFAGRSDLQRIPIAQLERVSTSLLRLLRSNAVAWEADRFRISVAPLCPQLETAIAELQQEREALRSAEGLLRHAYAESSRSGAADERELREQIGVLRALLRSVGHAEEASELRRIRPRPRRQKSERRAAAPHLPAKVPSLSAIDLPQYLRERMRRRKPNRAAHHRRRPRPAAPKLRLPGTS